MVVGQSVPRRSPCLAGKLKTKDTHGWHMMRSTTPPITVQFRSVAQGINVRERIQHALCEAQVAHCSGDAAFLDEKGPIPRGAGGHHPLWIGAVGIMKTRDQHASFNTSDQLLPWRLAGGDE